MKSGEFCGDVGSFPGFGRIITNAHNISAGKDEEEAASLYRVHR